MDDSIDGGAASHRDVGLDRVVRRIALDLKILDPVAINISGLAQESHRRERARRARDLFACLIEMVEIQMDVAPHPDQFARAEIGLLSKHELQRGGPREIEGGP